MIARCEHAFLNSGWPVCCGVSCLLCTAEKVLRLEHVSGTHVRVQTDRGVWYSAARCAVCVGAWIAPFASKQFATTPQTAPPSSTAASSSACAASSAPTATDSPFSGAVSPSPSPSSAAPCKSDASDGSGSGTVTVRPVELPPLAVWKQSWAYYPVKAEWLQRRDFEVGRFPVFIEYADTGCYGFPTFELPGYIKVQRCDPPHDEPHAVG